MKKILTAALMGYFMIIVFSIAGIPDPDKPIDALTAATKTAQIYNQPVQYTGSLKETSDGISSANPLPLQGDQKTLNTTLSTRSISLQNALMQRHSIRVFDIHRALDFQMIGQLTKKALSEDSLTKDPLRREVRINDRIKVSVVNQDNQLFTFNKKTATFQPLPVPAKNRQGSNVLEKNKHRPRDICFADFVKKAPGILFITGRDDNQSCMETGRFCQAMSLSLEDKGIGSCIVAWFDPQIAKTQLHLKADEKLLLALAFGFTPQISD